MNSLAKNLATAGKTLASAATPFAGITTAPGGAAPPPAADQPTGPLLEFSDTWDGLSTKVWRVLRLGTLCPSSHACMGSSGCMLCANWPLCVREA